MRKKPVQLLNKTNLFPFGGGLGYALLFIGIQILAIIPFVIIDLVIDSTEYEGAKEDLAFGLGIPIAFILGAYVLYRKRGLLATAFQFRPNFFKLIPLGFLLITGSTYVIEELMTFLPNYESLLASYKEMFANQNPILLLIGGALIGPICEEIIFRGIILEGFLQKYNPTKAIIFSALIFGVIHFHPLQSVGAFFAGLVLGWIYIKTKSLWVCSAIHIINNLLAFSFMDIDVSTREYLANDSLYIASFGIAALLTYVAFRYFNKVNSTTLVADNSTFL